MTEEEKLQKAYFVLGLQPGDPMDKVIRRHKRLIMVWHPDRFPNEDGKKDAEEELKQINNAKDDLKNHFEKNHKASGSCACRPTAGASSQQQNSSRGGGPGPGPGKRKTTQETNREEAEAQRRSREREAAAAAEAAEKERQRQAAASAAAQQQSAQQAVDQAKVLADERLRWKISLGIGAAWLALSVFGWAGTSLKSWWHDFSWKWERDHAPQQQYKAPDTSNNTSPYVPPGKALPPHAVASPYTVAEKLNAAKKEYHTNVWLSKLNRRPLGVSGNAHGRHVPYSEWGRANELLDNCVASRRHEPLYFYWHFRS